MFLEFLPYSPTANSRLEDLKEIFFLNSKTRFDDQGSKDLFFFKYAGVYIETWPDDVLFACDLETQQTLGYLLGCRNSLESLEKLSPNLKSYSVYEDLFKKYPAHFHINVHPDHHGKGAGSFLLQEFLIELRRARVKGVHIVTSPDEKNVEFYKKHKFKFRDEREFNDRKLLFMGRRL